MKKQKMDIKHGRILAFACCVGLIHAEENLKATSLETQVTSAQRIALEAKLLGQSSQKVSSEQIFELAPNNTAEILQKSGLATVQTSQVGGGSPILRGFEASRVLTVIDGVRMNNAIYRGGHLQSLITVDPYALESLELLLGPGSVAYGSDALGGVVILNTIKPQFAQDKKGFFKPRGVVSFGSAATSDFGSKSNATQLHTDFMVGLGALPMSFVSSITLSQYDDLRTGSWSPDADYSWGKTYNYVERQGGKDVVLPNSDPLVQKFSGYSQFDALQKMRWAITPYLEWNLNYQFSNSTDIPRYDRLSEINKGNPTYAEWYYGPQFRQLLSSELTHKGEHFIWDEAKLLLSMQNAEESRMSRKLDKATLKHQIENILVYRANLDMNKQLGNHTLRYGFEFGYDDVESKAYQDSVDNQKRGSAVATRYPQDGSSLMSEDVYLGNLWQFAPHWSFDLGTRFHAQQLKADFGNSPMKFPFKEVEQDNKAITGATGLVWAPESWKLSILASTGFKAPNIDDMGKVFDSDKGAKIPFLIVPNPDLKPEYSYNGEVAIEKSWAKYLQVEARAYETWLEDALIVKSGTLNGLSVVDYDGTPAQVQSMQNARNALLFGWSLSVKSQIWQDLNYSGQVQHTQGYLNGYNTDEPLDHQSPLQYNSSLSWTEPTWSIQAQILGALAKHKSDYYHEGTNYAVGEDNLIYATQNGLPAWWILNTRASYKIGQTFKIQAGLENIFDLNYRTPGSGSGAAGRMAKLSLQAGL